MNGEPTPKKATGAEAPPAPLQHPSRAACAAAQEAREQVLARMTAACASSGRAPESVTLLAVSKTFDARHVAAMASTGQRAFGENYLQEALAKRQAFADERYEPPLEWHFIGPIQSNKTRPIAEHFDWAHTVDREKVARRLSEQRPAWMPPLQVCLQVNIDDEASKSGCTPEESPALACLIAGLPGLTLRGLMAIPTASDDTARQRVAFAKVKALQAQCRNALAAQPELHAAAALFDTLSMGMTGDLEAAIAEGATIVRVGTALFGQRTTRAA